MTGPRNNVGGRFVRVNFGECAAKDCADAATTRGRCAMHNARFDKYQSDDLPDRPPPKNKMGTIAEGRPSRSANPIRTCICGTVFESYRNTKFCPPCRESNARYGNPQRWTRYGISCRMAEEMFAFQGGRCSIKSCRKELEFLRGCIDHDHSCCPTSGTACGECVRGILCVPCNARLGAVDDTEWLEAALEYKKAKDRSHQMELLYG